MRIAVVDDEETERNETAGIISRLYGKDKVSCFLFSDGEEILESLKNGFPFDAVFLDIEMKKMDGMT
ncbi:MAG: response regulator, partial [Clostridiales bacterium]|nr:response regulator [Clostridiales bacterium]